MPQIKYINLKSNKPYHLQLAILGKKVLRRKSYRWNEHFGNYAGRTSNRIADLQKLWRKFINGFYFLKMWRKLSRIELCRPLESTWEINNSNVFFGIMLFIGTAWKRSKWSGFKVVNIKIYRDQMKIAKSWEELFSLMRHYVIIM